ncbi:alpha/beta hydrolase [Streptomyces europaeiscabiei]|uniref:alpha/beta hydrolase n=1 Tax=Streptomyces europaeiscabiei TaxID=146819 RepID=UPI00299FCEF6|nr:alpha/beta hydrolase [Streptomyces europaeiscabiei]MDX3862202.1 alpha/beta hydrolase [Streptomyces europaeiscabiei]MDX3876617.1 alpha/beta hydrolase [Streptomyces europaeiscabiei]
MPIDVHFRSGGITVAGHLYLPEDYKEGQQRAAVVTVSPGGGIKEQTSGRYARELCDRGFVALAFDHRSYGESEGFPRYDEDPFAKIEDIKNAVSYLGNRPEVDPDRIGAMGICGGGGYAPAAAATDRRIKAVATVSGVGDHRGVFHEQTGSDHGVLVAMLEACGAARQAFSRGDEPTYWPLIPGPEVENVFAPLKEAPDYYDDSTRGAHPRWANKTLAWSLEKQLTFSALDVVSLIAPHPLLLIVGTESTARSHGEGMYAAAADPKELFLIDGASHLDLYDLDQYVKQAADKLADFFSQSL